MCWRILLQRNAQATLTFRSMARDTAPFMAFPVPPTQEMKTWDISIKVLDMSQPELLSGQSG